MSIAEKFEVIADAVYAKGMSDKESEQWDIVQDNGTRTNFSYAFARWNSEYIRPKHKVVPTDDVNHIFIHCHNLKKVESKYFDFSNVPTTKSFNAMFNSCYELKEIEDVNLCVGKMYQTFSFDWKLHTIARLIVSETVEYTDTFLQCWELKNIAFEGIIGKNINFKDCSLLTDASLKNIAEHLKEFSSPNSAVITLHSTVKNRIEGTPIYSAITGKGWTIV